MNKIKARFLEEQKNRPFLGDYPVFVYATRGRKDHPVQLAKAFNTLVGKDQYLEAEYDELLAHIIRMSTEFILE